MQNKSPETAGTVLGYFPVIHDGYLRLLNKHPEKLIGVLDIDILEDFDYLRKDIRALKPKDAGELLKGIGRSVELVGKRALVETVKKPGLIMPDDDVSRSLCEMLDISPPLEPVFLRWDKINTNSNADVEPDRIIEESDLPPGIISALRQEASYSTNWWRHVAVAIIENDSLVALAHNSSLPTPYSSAIDSDPRITESRGQSIEKTIDIHAEARVIAQQAKYGSATNDKDIIVTTFPCANCAKLIAESGFSKCYYIDGYANLDGQSILRSAGVEIVQVNAEPQSTERDRLRTYPKSNLF